jgi:hypothetical protein
MVGTINKFLLTVSVIAGMSAISTSTALAGSLTNPAIGGTSATDYVLYDADANTTFVVSKTLANLQKVLGGNSSSPTGNVELAASSEKVGFNFSKNTTLSGTIGSKSITLSSLKSSDWSTVVGGGKTLIDTWLKATLTTNGFGSIATNNTLYTQIKKKFTDNLGRQRFSDPNISYVNQDDTTGEISIGLAGHLNATDLLVAGMTTLEKLAFFSLRSADKQGQPIQASEIVKVTYNGINSYLYSFTATGSGLHNPDSVKGNYEVKLPGVK